MLLKDRKKLASLMVINDVSHRQLAAAAGWTGHSIIDRLLKGQLHSVTSDRAVLIASHLGVSLEVLFEPRTASDHVLLSQKGRQAA